MNRLSRMFADSGSWFGPAALILWLETLVWLLAGGRYKAYLKPGLAPFLIFAALTIFAFLLVFLLSGRVGQGRAKAGEAAAKALMLVLPVFYLYAIHGQHLGGEAFKNRVVGASTAMASPAGGRDAATPPDIGPEAASMPSGDTSLLDIAAKSAEFDGRDVSVSGMVYRDPNTPPGSFVLFRFVIMCCAADATPVWALVRWPESAELENDGWIQVKGVLNVEDFKGGKVPVIRAQGLTAIPEPPVAERYLYLPGT